ncbi:MAG: response regulator [Acidobacteriota bacterium]
MNRRSVLFVDDQREILSGLRRMLYPHRQEWEMFFASGADEALSLLETQVIDIVIADMKMPRIDGAELLEIVRREFPGTARIVLSGETEPNAVLRTVGTVHQYLAKPCSAESLRSTIERAVFVKELLESHAALQSLIGRIDVLPAIPALYLRVAHELQSEEPSLKRIGELVSQDPGMSAKILQLVNSAFFGLPREIDDPTRAIMLLGLEVTRALVLSVEIFSQYQITKLGGIAWETLWSHSLACARLAQHIARGEWPDDARVQDRAYITGLLHDVGKLVLAAIAPEGYRHAVKEAAEDSIPLVEAEGRQWGVGHPTVGAFLMGLWGLPIDLVEAILWHHEPQEATSSEHRELILLVHAADVLADECGFPSGNPMGGLDQVFDDEPAILARFENWRSMAFDLLGQGVDRQESDEQVIDSPPAPESTPPHSV